MLINATLLTCARLSFLVWMVDRDQALNAHRCQACHLPNEVMSCKFLNFMGGLQFPHP